MAVGPRSSYRLITVVSPQQAGLAQNLMLVPSTPSVYITLPHLGEQLCIYQQWTRKLKCCPPMNYVLIFPSDICLNHSTMKGSKFNGLAATWMFFVYKKMMTMTTAIVINANILSKLLQTLRALCRISHTHGNPTILLTILVPIPQMQALCSHKLFNFPFPLFNQLF